MQKIIKNNNGTVTVVNKRIRVTTSADDFEKFGRAKILSDAMRQLGNASELKMIKSEPITNEEVRQKAQKILFHEYLFENCHYDLPETLMRYYGGHRMSTGMTNEVNTALAYAAGIMEPISNDRLMELMDKLMKADKSGKPNKREIKKLGLQRNLDNITPDSAIEKAINKLEEERISDMKYRNHFANFRNHWLIEIIGDMPAEIGTCRYIENEV